MFCWLPFLSSSMTRMHYFSGQTPLSCFFIVHTKESSLPPLCIFNNRFPPFYIYVAENSLATATITHVLPPGLRSLSSINVFKRGCYYSLTRVVRLLLRICNQQKYTENFYYLFIYLVVHHTSWMWKPSDKRRHW